MGSEEWWFIKMFSGVLVFAFSFAFFLVYLIEYRKEHRCDQYAVITGVETTFSWFDACYINHEGEWMRYEAYEKVIVARDGLRGVK